MGSGSAGRTGCAVPEKQKSPKATTTKILPAVFSSSLFFKERSYSTSLEGGAMLLSVYFMLKSFLD
jgi:hypothetical protein